MKMGRASTATRANEEESTAKANKDNPTTPATPSTTLTTPEALAKGRGPEHGHAEDDDSYPQEEVSHEEKR